MTCKTVMKDGVRFFLPDCLGGAVSGLIGCTCNRTKAKSDLEERVAVLEKKVAQLSKQPTRQSP